MLEEKVQFFFAMGPDNTSVINKPFPKLRMKKGGGKGRRFKIFHENISHNGGWGKPMATPQVCSNISPLKLNKVEVIQIPTRWGVLGSVT